MPADSCSIQSLSRAFEIIEHLSECPHGMSLTKLSDMMVLSKSTVHRFLSSLIALGYVYRDSDVRYRLTLRMYEVGARSVKVLDILEYARPMLNRLAEGIGISVHMVTLTDNQVLYLYKKNQSAIPLNISSYIGSTAPVYCTGVGKAIMAYLPEEKAYDIWTKQEVIKYTETTITTWPEMQKVLTAIREKGYATDNEEHEPGICCIALPAFDYRNIPKYAISMTFSKTRFSPAFIEEKLPLLQHVANSLSTFSGADLLHLEGV